MADEFANESGELIFPFTGLDSQSGQVITTLGFRSEIVPTVNQVDDIFDNRCDGFLSNLCVTTTTLGPLRCRYQEGDDVILIDGTHSDEGTQGAPAIPGNVSLLLTKSTGLAGRRNRGRMFIPGVPRARLDAANDSHWTSAVVDDGVDWLNDVAAGMNIFQWTPVIHHRGTDEPPVAPSFTDIVAFGGQQLVATQRRRIRD